MVKEIAGLSVSIGCRNRMVKTKEKHKWAISKQSVVPVSFGLLVHQWHEMKSWVELIKARNPNLNIPPFPEME